MISVKTQSHRVLLSLSCLVFLGLSACGKPLVTDIKLRTYLEEEDTYVEARANIATGKIRLPALDLPIPNPKHLDQQIGRVGVKPVLTGGSEVTIAVNLTEAAHLPGGLGLTLPNGTLIPIGGMGTTPVIGLKIGNASRVYVAYNPPGVAMLGVALTLKEFDEIGRKVGITNLFLPFRIRGVNGTGGLFTSNESGHGGIGLFADLSSLLPEISTRMSFAPQSPSGQSNAAINEKLYRWDGAAKRLTHED